MSKYTEYIVNKIDTFTNSISNKNTQNKFNNSLIFSNQMMPHKITINELSLVNSMLPDRGFANPLTNPTSQDYESDEMVDLIDKVRVRRTIENCRMAMKIEPFCRASALMMMILVSSDFEIYGIGDVDREVLNRIKDNARDVWELESKIFGMAWRTIVDGRFFMNKILDEKTNNLLCEFLAYDAKDYDFIPIQNPLDPKVKGYVQKAKVWEYPENWDKIDEAGNPKYTFEELAKPKTRSVSIPLQANQVIYGNFLEDGEGLIMSILDDVLALKEITNSHPDIIKMQLGLLFVQMGTENFPFMPFEDYDDQETQAQKLGIALDEAQESFEKALKDQKLLVGTQTTNPKFVGTSNIGALNLSFATQIHAHRIFIGLLTPPGRWEGSGTNKASIETQIGDGGQYSAVYFIQNMIKRTIERDLINHQIELLVPEFGEKAKKAIDKIKLRFRIKNLEDRKKLAEVFQILETFFPSKDHNEFMRRLEAYFPELHKKEIEKDIDSISDGKYEDGKFKIPDEIKIPKEMFNNQLNNGILDTSDNAKFIQGMNNWLKEKGIFDES